ncbi:hypothetical protein LTR49_027912 [Elasticomyces elasticus]|nr:hypothetical protein LTR49_027912 [Elasticomyces elasticus]
MPVVPPGQYAPFATVTKDDHAAGIIIATALGVAFTTLLLTARVFIRQFVNVGWQWDDSTLVLSTFVSWIQSAVILAACHEGLGKSLKLIPLQSQGRVQQLYYAGNLLYVCAVQLSRMSVVLFLRRLTAPGTNFASWEAQAIVACLMEVAIYVAPVWLVWKLQKSRKIRLEIVAWFSVRLLVIILTGKRLQSFDRAGFATDPTLHEATYICLTQAELCFSIIAATIPVARTLVTELVTYYNAGHFDSSVYGDGSRGYTYRSYPMKTLKSSGKRKSDHGQLGSGNKQSADDDGDSQELIIRKDTTIHVTSEGTGSAVPRHLDDT